jgi:hypothetical protein
VSGDDDQYEVEVDPDLFVEIDPDEADELLGLSEEDAEDEAAERGWLFRVGSRDGMFFPLTREYRLNRVTVSVDEDEVTSVEIG